MKKKKRNSENKKLTPSRVSDPVTSKLTPHCAVLHCTGTGHTISITCQDIKAKTNFIDKILL